MFLLRFLRMLSVALNRLEIVVFIMDNLVVVVGSVCVRAYVFNRIGAERDIKGESGGVAENPPN